MRCRFPSGFGGLTGRLSDARPGPQPPERRSIAPSRFDFWFWSHGDWGASRAPKAPGSPPKSLLSPLPTARPFGPWGGGIKGGGAIGPHHLTSSKQIWMKHYSLMMRKGIPMGASSPGDSHVIAFHWTLDRARSGGVPSGCSDAARRALEDFLHRVMPSSGHFGGLLVYPEPGFSCPSAIGHLVSRRKTPG